MFPSLPHHVICRHQDHAFGLSGSYLPVVKDSPYAQRTIPCLIRGLDDCELYQVKQTFATQ